MPQYIRKASLLVLKRDSGVGMGMTVAGVRVEAPKDDPTFSEALDLSEMRFTFRVSNMDEQEPSNCYVRVFNLSTDTVAKLLKQSNSRLVLQGGYEDSYGVIFMGDIKQFRTGRINATDTYLDILAADGDLAYAFGFVNQSIEASQTNPAQQAESAVAQMNGLGVTMGYNGLQTTGGILPRGKVKVGMARSILRDLTFGAEASWSIQNGKVIIIPLDQYLPGVAVKLSAATGLIGVPEQTQDGIRCRCLLNPKIGVGARVQIDNASIVQTIDATDFRGVAGTAQRVFNSYTATQLYPSIARDGFYRVYIAEHDGDTRGNEWETQLTCLAIDASTENVV